MSHYPSPPLFEALNSQRTLKIFSLCVQDFSKSSTSLIKIRMFFRSSILIYVYYSSVQSLLPDCYCLWENNYRCLLSPLTFPQKTILRLITFSPYLALSIALLLQYNKSMVMNKILINLGPQISTSPGCYVTRILCLL